MFFDMFTKEEINYVDDDYKILDNDSISTYDNKEIENRVKKLINNIKELECKYLEFIITNITPNYEIKEEMFSLKRSDKTGNAALKRIETEDDLKKIYNKFNFIFNNLF